MIYKRIRDLREDKDLTQTEVATVLNVTQRAYSYYERGQHCIPPEILVRIARFHNTSVDYILEITDVNEPYEQKNK